MKHFYLLSVLYLLLGVQAHAQRGQLYSGLLEKGYPKTQYANTPYYPQDYQRGRVTYHGYTYEDVSLKTDLATGQLIILSPATGFSLTYAPKSLDYVEMNGSELLYLEKPSAGWYELVASGPGWVLYRQNSVSGPVQEIQGPVMVSRFIHSQRIYLCKGESWIPVNNLGAFCKQFKEHKSEIQAFAKKQGLKLNAQNLDGWKLLGEFVNKY